MVKQHQHQKWVHLYRYKIFDFLLAIAESELPHEGLLEMLATLEVPLPGFVVSALIRKMLSDPKQKRGISESGLLGSLNSLESDFQKSFFARDQGFLYQYLLNKGQVVDEEFFTQVCTSLGVSAATANFRHTEYLNQKNRLVDDNHGITAKGRSFLNADSLKQVRTMKADGAYRTYSPEDCSIIKSILEQGSDGATCRKALEELAESFEQHPYDSIEPENMAVVVLALGTALLRPAGNLDGVLTGFRMHWGYAMHFVRSAGVKLCDALKQQIVDELKRVGIYTRTNAIPVIRELAPLYGNVEGVMLKAAGKRDLSRECNEWDIPLNSWEESSESTNVNQIHLYKTIVDGAECRLRLKLYKDDAKRVRRVLSVDLAELDSGVEAKQTNKENRPKQVCLTVNVIDEMKADYLAKEFLKFLRKKQGRVGVPLTEYHVDLDDNLHGDIELNDMTDVKNILGKILGLGFLTDAEREAERNISNE